MANIEGMYALLSGSVVDDEMDAGGIVILETGRLFGGDSAIAYRGGYEARDGRVVGHVESWKFNPKFEGFNVFGLSADIPMSVDFEVAWRDAEHLTGEVWAVAQPAVRLPVVLRKIAELP